MRNGSIKELASTLSNLLDRPVVNRTGIEGEFDITMEYDLDTADAPGAQISPGTSAMFGSSFFAALQDQLGLRLESTKAVLDVLVIDHADKPSAN